MRNQALPLTVGILAPVFSMGMAQIPPWTPWRLMEQALVYATGGVAPGSPDAALDVVRPDDDMRGVDGALKGRTG